MRKNKKIFLLVLISFFLLPCALGAQVNASAAEFSDVILVQENGSTAQEATDAASSGSIKVDQTVSRSFQGNLSGTITKTMQGGQQQMLQFSSVSNSVWFTRHLMCKDHDDYYNPIDLTTIFRPSDIKAVCLTTISTDDTNASVHSIEFRWHYRSNSSKTWVSCHSPDWPPPVGYFLLGGIYTEQRYQCNFSIAGYWPGSNYPWAYKVDVYLDGSFSFSEFFEVTNGGLNSPRMCEDVDENGNPVNMKSRFTIDNDTRAYHYLRFDKIAYFNDKCCHNFTTVWIQPNGSTYKTYSGSFPDYKDTNVTWNYWEFNCTQDDYISINPSTPVGNWTVEVYLDSYFNNTWMRYGPVATTPFIVGSEPVADWTFMVYLDADMNIEEAGIEIFEYMASVDSSSRVNIVVQMDRIEGYDSRHGNWSDCKRFNVTKDLTPTPENSIDDLDEKNMGDPNTLKKFVNWTINNYPANYYFLVLWDHGAGFMGVCLDITDADVLSLPELSQALSGLPAIMDVVLLDACSMSMTEVAYQIKDYANVLVGPEGLGYAPAPYDEYLSSLTSNPSMSPSAFAREVVTDYIDWCNSRGDIQNATMSATDLTKITSLMAAIDDFALKLREKETPYLSLLFESHEQIILARNLTAGYIGPYSGNTSCYIDLYHFAQLTYQYVLDEELRNTADQVMTTLESIIIIEGDKARPDSHGLSIFFPDEKWKYDSFGSVYEKTTFAEDTPWDEFVKYHLSGYVLTIKTPYPDIPIKVDEESYTPDAEGKIRVFVLPDSYTVNVTTSVSTGPGSREVFTQWNDNDTSNPRTLFVNRTLTLEAEYETQYEVTFDQSGVGADFTETVVTINETGYNVTGLPVSLWWDNGSTLSFAFQSPLVVTPNAKRYVWNSTSGLSFLQSDSITVSTSGNITGNYKTQFYLTVISPYDTPAGEGWYYEGNLAFATLATGIVDHGNGTRRVFTHWSGDASGTGLTSNPITMDGSKTAIANWKTQYLVTFGQTGLDPTATGTVLTVNGDTKTFLSLPNTTWVDDGGSISYYYSDTVSGSIPGKRFSLVNVTGPASPINVTGPVTVTGNYKTQYYLTMSTNFGTVTPGSGWHDAGSTVSISASAPSVVDGERCVWLGWTGTGPGSYSSTDNPASVTMDGPITETAAWRHEYRLTVASPYGSPTPTSDWREAGESITASVTSPWPLGATDTQHVCTGWTGTGSVSTSGLTTSVTFTIDKPSSIRWNWKTQYLLTVRTDPTGLSPRPNVSPPGSWYDNGTLVTCTAQKISGYVFDHWTVDGASWDRGINPITVTMDGPYEATAHYVHARAWWETLFRPEMLQVILGLVGVVLTVAFVGTAWVRTRRRRGIIKALLNEIDEVYSTFKTNPPKCEEELYRLRNTVLEGLTDGKITEENYNALDKRIDKYLEELGKQKWRERAEE